MCYMIPEKSLKIHESDLDDVISMATMNGTDSAENGNNCNASMGPNQLIEALGLKEIKHFVRYRTNYFS